MSLGIRVIVCVWRAGERTLAKDGNGSKVTVSARRRNREIALTRAASITEGRSGKPTRFDASAFKRDLCRTHH